MKISKNEFSLAHIPNKSWWYLCIQAENWYYRPKYCKFIMLGVVSLLKQSFLLLIAFCTYFVTCTVPTFFKWLNQISKLIWKRVKTLHTAVTAMKKHISGFPLQISPTGCTAQIASFTFFCHQTYLIIWGIYARFWFNMAAVS